MKNTVFYSKKKFCVLLILHLSFINFSHAQVGSLIWEENFDTLNPMIWNVSVGNGLGTPAGIGFGNQELQYYKQSNVLVEDVPGELGNKALVFEAKRENIGSNAFTSGKVESYNKLAVHYGMIEIRARIPNLDTGLWPALWLLGTANVGWPKKGEIDIVEMGHKKEERTRQGFPSASINNYLGSNLIFYSDSALSTSNPTGAAGIAYDVNYNKPYVANIALTDRFLKYRLYWSSSSIRFTVIDNGNEVDLYEAPFVFNTDSDEFKQPFYFLLNLAVGGNFTDALTNSEVTAPIPAKMYVDYIKVYKWNGEGEVKIGGAVAEKPNFGVFTENTVVTNKLNIGANADIYTWNNMSQGSNVPFEGSEVIAWQTNAPNTWFGGGIAARQPLNLNNFATGKLKFRIKIPANVNFKIGITDNYTNEKFVSFPANTTKYGLTRDGNWGQVSIPVADFLGTIALQNINYAFAIASDGELSNSTFQLAIDEVYFEENAGLNIENFTNQENRNIYLYPNPANSELFLQNKKEKMYSILNINGVKLIEGYEDKISIQSLAAGMYFVAIDDVVLKFIKN